MTWPGWGDLLPSMTLVATNAALLWAVVRLLMHPVAEMAASEAGKRVAKATRATVDELYERLRANDFRHVQEGLKALGDRIDGVGEDFGGRIEGVREDFGGRIEGVREDFVGRIAGVREDFGGRFDRMDKRIAGVREDFGGRLDRMDERLDRMDERIAGVRKDVGDRLELARRDRMDMEARLMAAIQGG